MLEKKNIEEEVYLTGGDQRLVAISCRQRRRGGWGLREGGRSLQKAMKQNVSLK